MSDIRDFENRNEGGPERTRPVQPVAEKAAEPSPRRRRADKYNKPETAEVRFTNEGPGAQEAPGTAYTPVRPAANRTAATFRESAPRIPQKAKEMNASTRARVEDSAARLRAESMRAGRPAGNYAPPRGPSQNARAYAPSTSRAGMSQNSGRPASRPVITEREEPQRRHHGLTVAVILIVLIGAALIGLKHFGILDKILGKSGKDPLQGISLKVSNQEAVAPAEIVFMVTTGKSVEEIRLVDNQKKVMNTRQDVKDDIDTRAWTMTLYLEEGYQGDTWLQVLSGDEWKDTDKGAMLYVTVVPTAEPAAQQESRTDAGPTPTPIPTEQVSVVITESVSPVKTPSETPPADGTEPAEEGQPGEETEPGAGAAPGEGTAPADQTEPGEEAGPSEAAEPSDGAESEKGNTSPEGLTEDGPDPLSNGQTPEAEEPAATPSPEPTATPGPTPTPALTAEACEAADPSLIKNITIYNGNKAVKEYTRPARDLIHMPVGGEYTRDGRMGVLTFRGDAFRRNAASGTVEGASDIAEAWKFEAGSVRGTNKTYYYGIGWTGQPAIVQWTKNVRENSNLDDAKKEKKGLKEVIAAGLDGNIYFLDLDDGVRTRNYIKLGYPMRGTPCIHPGGAPYMSVGQYARKMYSGTGKIGLRQYNLYIQKEMTLIDGLDGKLRRAFNEVGSFETSALMDRTSESTIITAGTNGLLYVIDPGEEFDYNLGTYRQSASMVLLKSKAAGESAPDTAVEASVAMYDRYVFYADVGGILRCVDTNTMLPVWAVNTGDTVESTPALELNGEGGLDLYTANILSKRKKGDAEIRKYDAMTGEEKWCVSFNVKKDTNNKTVSGFRASPVVGENSLSGLVYYTVSNLSAEGMASLGVTGETSALIALDKEDGSIVWAYEVKGPAYSSPVAVYSEDGRGWIIQCGRNGTISLLDGLSGAEISTLIVEGEIEASPAVYNDMMVIGTTANTKGKSFIYGIRIVK